MSTIWEGKIVAINPLYKDNVLIGTAIVGKNQKYFYSYDTDIKSLLSSAKHTIAFDEGDYNFRALYYQFKPDVKFKNITDIIKQEYFTCNTQDAIYFDNPEGSKQAIIEAVFMLEFFLANYKKRNKFIYKLDNELLNRFKNYQGIINIDQVKIRTELSLIQKQQWDIERQLFNKMGYPISNLMQIKDLDLRKGAEDYLEKIKKYKQHYEELINYLGIDKLKIDFDLTSTATGRIICRDRENNIGLIAPDKQYRKIFIANKGSLFISADYKRQEANILALVSNDEQLKVDLQNEDFYSKLARKMLGKSEKQIGKVIFYAVIYGAKPVTVANELDIEIEFAVEIIDNIKKRYAVLNYWLKNFKEKVNYFGRPLHKNTVNAYVQSTAADILRQRLLDTSIFNPVLILADNIIYQVDEDSLSLVKKTLKSRLENTEPFELKVALKTSNTLVFD